MSTISEREIATRLRAQLERTPPVPGLAERAMRHARRGRTRRLEFGAALAAAVAALAIVAVPLLWEAGSSRVVTPAAARPTWGPWIQDGTLHLGETDVPVPTAPEGLVAVLSGAVYATAKGSVVWVRADGDQDTIGLIGYAGSALVSDRETGWVAWVEGTTEQGPELVVYDTENATELARTPLSTTGPRSRYEALDSGATPIAIDAGTVYYAAVDADYRWQVGKAAPEPILSARAWLVDQQAGVQVRRSQRAFPFRFDVVRASSEDPPVVIRGLYDGTLAPDGDYLLDHPNGTDESALLYDTRTGAALDTGLPPGVLVTDAVFGADGTVTYALGDPPPPERGPALGGVTVLTPVNLRLVTCVVATASCETSVADAGEQVDLAGH